MKISERDIFNYVYDKGKLLPEIIRYIEENKISFNEIIAFYQSFRNKIDDPLSQAAESGLIEALNNRNKFELLPVTALKDKEKITRLAADSVMEDRTVKALSFTDKEAKHIIRALFFPDKTELYVLSPANRKLENFSVVTKPSQKEYYFKDNKHPVITSEKVIEQIDILYH